MDKMVFCRSEMLHLLTDFVRRLDRSKKFIKSDTATHEPLSIRSISHTPCCPLWANMTLSIKAKVHNAFSSEKHRATARNNMYRKLREVWTCRFWHMQTYRQTYTFIATRLTPYRWCGNKQTYGMHGSSTPPKVAEIITSSGTALTGYG